MNNEDDIKSDPKKIPQSSNGSGQTQPLGAGAPNPNAIHTSITAKPGNENKGAPSAFT